MSENAPKKLTLGGHLDLGAKTTPKPSLPPLPTTPGGAAQQQTVDNKATPPLKVTHDDEVIPSNKNVQTVTNDKSEVNVGQLLDGIIEKALLAKASDVHIEPQEEKVVVRFRIDGILREIVYIEKELEPALTFKIKINAKLRTDEHFAPQDGRIAFMVQKRRIDTRISILPTTKGEKIVIRLLAADADALSLENLGIVGKQLEMIQKSYSKPYGMILAVGPTGSGKTTTLYSILKLLNSRDVNITTVEDPVEYDIDGINHVQINVKADLTFANGLRAILRQDPNIIMIGEIRDAETAKIAINAAMTGHMVLSTLHTNDAVTTIPRLLDMGVEKFLVASTLNVIVAQRLARRLCKNCKQEVAFSAAEHEELKKIRPDLASLIKPGSKIFKEKGCAECGDTGFRGRVGLYEILEVHETIRKIIIEGSGNVDDLFKQARTEGLVLIVEDGVKKLGEGTVSVSELIRVTALKE
jgi:general secretion pathway protein E